MLAGIKLRRVLFGVRSTRMSITNRNLSTLPLHTPHISEASTWYIHHQHQEQLAFPFEHFVTNHRGSRHQLGNKCSYFPPWLEKTKILERIQDRFWLVGWLVGRGRHTFMTLTWRVRMSWRRVTLCVIAEGENALKKVRSMLVSSSALRNRLSGSAQCYSPCSTCTAQCLCTSQLCFYLCARNALRTRCRSKRFTSWNEVLKSWNATKSIQVLY